MIRMTFRAPDGAKITETAKNRFTAFWITYFYTVTGCQMEKEERGK